MSGQAQRVVVLLDNIRSLYNTGSILRTADASGVERVVLCGITPRPDQGSRQRRAIAKTALGAEDSVPWEYQPDAHAALRTLVAAGYHTWPWKRLRTRSTCSNGRRDGRCVWSSAMKSMEYRPHSPRMWTR